MKTCIGKPMARSSHPPVSIPLSPVTTDSLTWNTLILGFREVSLNRSNWLNHWALMIKLNLAFLPSQRSGFKPLIVWLASLTTSLPVVGYFQKSPYSHTQSCDWKGLVINKTTISPLKSWRDCRTEDKRPHVVTGDSPLLLSLREFQAFGAGVRNGDKDHIYIYGHKSQYIDNFYTQYQQPYTSQLKVGKECEQIFL